MHSKTIVCFVFILALITCSRVARGASAPIIEIPTEPNKRAALEYRLSVIQYHVSAAGMVVPIITEEQSASLEMCLLECWKKFESLAYCLERIDLMRPVYHMCNYDSADIGLWKTQRKVLMKSWGDKIQEATERKSRLFE